jgi:hypothetical protein
MGRTRARTAAVGLRRRHSDRLTAEGLLIDPTTAYFRGVLDELDDSSAFEVIVLAPQSREIERFAPTAVHLGQPAPGSRVQGFTVVKLATASRFEPPPLRRWGRDELRLAIGERTAAASGSDVTPRAQDGAGVVVSSLGDETAGDAVADTILETEADSFRTEVLVELPVEDDQSAVPEVSSWDIDPQYFGIVRVLCEILRICGEPEPEDEPVGGEAAEEPTGTP